MAHRFAQGATRREALGMIAVTASGAFVAASMRPAAAQSLISGAAMCRLMPETTAGPFYFDPQLRRSDISEGRAGVPLTARFQIVSGDCRPLAGARLDIWHCDAQGAYSGYRGQPGGLDTRGQTFMRGTQFAGGDGIVSFSTIYPGWYPGRSPHIHFSAIVEDRVRVTGQMFFPDSLSRDIYSSVPPYSDRAVADAVFNDRDGIARRAGRTALADMARAGERLQSALVVAIG